MAVTTPLAEMDRDRLGSLGVDGGELVVLTAATGTYVLRLCARLLMPRFPAPATVTPRAAAGRIAADRLPASARIQHG